jgi:hypothetical protein
MRENLRSLSKPFCRDDQLSIRDGGSFLCVVAAHGRDRRLRRRPGPILHAERKSRTDNSARIFRYPGLAYNLRSDSPNLEGLVWEEPCGTSRTRAGTLGEHGIFDRIQGVLTTAHLSRTDRRRGRTPFRVEEVATYSARATALLALVVLLCLAGQCNVSASQDPYLLGINTFQQGRITEALQHFREASRLRLLEPRRSIEGPFALILSLPQFTKPRRSRIRSGRVPAG